MLKQRAKAAVIVSAMVLCVGCYSLQPIVGPTPSLGTTVAVSINDAGRVALGGSMGPAIDEVEGRLVQRDSTEYLLSVVTVRFLRGGEQTWTGERVRIKSEFVSVMKEKKFSRGRTALISAVALGAVAAFVTRAIVGSGQGELPRSPLDSTAQSIRIPLH